MLLPLETEAPDDLSVEMMSEWDGQRKTQRERKAKYTNTHNVSYIRHRWRGGGNLLCHTRCAIQIRSHQSMCDIILMWKWKQWQLWFYYHLWEICVDSVCTSGVKLDGGWKSERNNISCLKQQQTSKQWRNNKLHNVHISSYMYVLSKLAVK